jgi:hypothetical protein
MAMKTTNNYATQFRHHYARTPKAVFAAIAFSFAQRLAADDSETALRLFFTEWKTLNLNGHRGPASAVPQMWSRSPTERQSHYEQRKPATKNESKSPPETPGAPEARRRQFAPGRSPHAACL